MIPKQKQVSHSHPFPGDCWADVSRVCMMTCMVSPGLQGKGCVPIMKYVLFQALLYGWPRNYNFPKFLVILIDPPKLIYKHHNGSPVPIFHCLSDLMSEIHETYRVFKKCMENACIKMQLNWFHYFLHQNNFFHFHELFKVLLNHSNFGKQHQCLSNDYWFKTRNTELHTNIVQKKWPSLSRSLIKQSYSIWNDWLIT